MQMQMHMMEPSVGPTMAAANEQGWGGPVRHSMQPPWMQQSWRHMRMRSMPYGRQPWPNTSSGYHGHAMPATPAKPTARLRFNSYYDMPHATCPLIQ